MLIVEGRTEYRTHRCVRHGRPRARRRRGRRCRSARRALAAIDQEHAVRPYQLDRPRGPGLVAGPEDLRGLHDDGRKASLGRHPPDQLLGLQLRVPVGVAAAHAGRAFVDPPARPQAVHGDRAHVREIARRPRRAPLPPERAGSLDVDGSIEIEGLELVQNCGEMKDNMAATDRIPQRGGIRHVARVRPRPPRREGRAPARGRGRGRGPRLPPSSSRRITAPPTSPVAPVTSMRFPCMSYMPPRPSVALPRAHSSPSAADNSILGWRPETGGGTEMEYRRLGNAGSR